jgi:UDP-glucose 4-epimerase
MAKSKVSYQKALVTGASGFIGSHLCRRLCEIGVEVHGISRKDRTADQDGLRWWKGDLSNTETVHKLLKKIKPDLIFHLASHVLGARDIIHVLPTFYDNLLSSLNLLLNAHEVGCKRIILTGSQDEPDLGDSKAIPSSPYVAAKMASSAYARMFYALYQLPVVNLRVFMVYGPDQQDLSKLVPYTTLSLLRKEVPKVGSGTRQVDWVFVDDVVQAYLAAAQASGLEGKTIEVGSGKLTTVRAVVENLNQMIDPEIRPLFGFLPDRPLEQIRVADTSKAQKLMGWKPETSLEDGLRQTIEWYKRHLKEGNF